MVAQLPQWAASVLTLAQLLSQSTVPAEQELEHCPLSQTWPVPQALPQPPQWAALLAVLTQVFSHIERPLEHAPPGAPPLPPGLAPVTLPTHPAATQTRIPARAASLESFMKRNPLLNCPGSACRRALRA